MMNALLIAWVRFAETLVNYTLGALLISLLFAMVYTAYNTRQGRAWRVTPGR